MKQWFEALSRRDQLLLVPLGFAMVFALFYGIIWAPASGAVSRYEASNAAARDTLDWMRQAAADIAHSRSSAASKQAGQSLSTTIDSSLPKYKLTMQRFQPVGETTAQIWLEEAPMSQVIAWLASLEQNSAMHLDNVSMVAADKQGRVKVRVHLSKS